MITVRDRNLFYLALSLWAFCTVAFICEDINKPKAVPTPLKVETPVKVEKKLKKHKWPHRTLKDFQDAGEISGDARILDAGGIRPLGDEGDGEL